MNQLNRFSSKPHEHQQKQKHNFWFDEIMLADGMNAQTKTNKMAPELSDVKSNDSIIEKKASHMFDPLLMFFKLAYCTLFFPSKIIYDSERNIFMKSQTSAIRKIIVGMTHAINLAINIQLYTVSPSSSSTPVRISYQITYFVFVFVGITFHYVSWAKIKQTVILLNELQELAIKIYENLSWRNVQSWKKRSTIITWIFGIWFVAQGFIYGLINKLYMANIPAITATSTSFIEIPARGGEDFLRFYTGDLILTKTTNMAEKSLAYLLVVGLLFTIILMYHMLVWCVASLSLFLWCFLFRLILKQLHEIIRIGKKDENVKPVDQAGKLSALDATKTFMQVTSLLEKFNEIFGINVFFTVIMFTLFNSIHLWVIANGTGPVTSVLPNYIVVSAFLVFTFTLLLAAEVNHLVNSLGGVIKIRFQSLQEGWNDLGRMDPNEFQLKQHELTRGISMINAETVKSSVGIKGHGFFTITYSFLGTIVSTITTYAIVVFQFTPPACKCNGASGNTTVGTSNP